MLDFWQHLFDPSGFMPRWYCGSWSEALGWLHILSDLGIWSAYFAIPALLFAFVRRRRDIPFRGVFGLFGAFILACGTTHLMEAIIFWYPLYRLAGVIKVVTAIVSWATLVALVPIIPKALAMRSPEELEREIAARKEAELALQQANEELESRVEERTRQLAKANAAVREERDRFQTTLSSIGDAVITTDTRGRVVFLNGVAQALIGWPENEAVGRPLEDVFRILNEHTRQPAESPVSRVIREGTVVGLANHTILIAQDGTEIPIDDSAAPIKNDKGETVGVVLVFRDVTEHRRADAEDRKNREILRFVHQIGKIGHWEWNLLRDENKWSPEIEALYGLTPGTFEGTYQAWAKLVHPDDLPRAEEDVRKAQETDKYFSEFRVIWPDGTVHWLEARANVFKDQHDKPVRIIGVNMDITDRKRQEEALRTSEQRWRTLTETLPNLVWTDLPEGQCDWLSSQWGKYTGIPESELLGLAWLERVIHPDDRERTLTCWEAACAGRADYDLEYRIRRHDGAYRWFKTRGVPIRDEQGKITYWIGTCTDIEDVKLMEAALREGDRKKDEFLATLAHELRNPLAPLRNALAILKLSGPNPQIFEQSRELMERQLQQMIRLVDDLMDVSRITRGKIELRKERVELATIVQSAVETSRPLIEASKHELTVQLPVTPIYVDADVTRLAQVFANLLNNSAKYTERGGRIWLTVDRQGNDAVVSVRDNGVGVPPEMLPRIFEMFTQVDRTLERSQGGLGIGLTLVKRLAEMHGGRVEAKSEGHGRGSDFTVWLPIVAMMSAEPGAPASDADGGGGGPKRRIVVADDNKDSAASLAMMLRIMGHEVRVAHDGLEAVETATKFQPDIVFLDIGMPKMNGYDAARRIRELPGGNSMVLAALTGWGQDEDKRRSREAGFDHHMVKPVDPAALEKLLSGRGLSSA